MTTEDLAAGNLLKTRIDLIEKIEAAIDADGSQAFILIADATDKQQISNGELESALGTSAFNTLAGNTLADIVVALDTAKTATEASLLAL